MALKQVVESKLYTVPAEGFVQGVKVACRGNLVFVSGVTARLGDGSVAAEGDPAGQARQVLENLAGVVEAAGGHMEDVVHTVTYLTDITHVDTVQRIKKDFFTIPPASTTVEISRLVDPRQLIEIEAIALVADD